MADNPMYKVGKDLQKFSGSAPTILNNKVNEINNARITPTNTSQYYMDTYGTGSNYYKNKTGGSSSGSSGGTSRTGTSSNASVSGNDLQSQLQSLYAQRQASASNRMGALQNAYVQQRNALESSFNTGRGVLDNSYNNSLSKIDNDAKKTLQESYVNRMLTQKNLGQQLAAQGISGGASESAMAGIANDYGNSRNSINETWNNNKADLSNTYQNSLAQLIQSYNSDLAQLESNYANQQSSIYSDLENGIADGVGDYSSMLMRNPKLFAALSSTQNSMNAYNPVETAAINGTDAVNTQQVTDAGDSTNYARYKAMLDQYVNAGLNKGAIVRSLGMAGADNSMIFKILSDNGM